MSLLNSLFAGVSGLRNHQSMMDVIGNNIANVNSIGFKGSRVTFSDTFNQFIRYGNDPTETAGGTNTYQIGLGMKLNSVDRNWNQGTFERTGIVTDLALQGDGLFVLENNGQRFFSRAGAFTFDAAGNLVNPQNGGIVQGKLATEDGVIPPGNNLENIVVDQNLRLPAIATTTTSWGGNLDSTSPLTRSENFDQTGNLNSALANGSTVATTNTIYDTNGNAYDMDVVYTKNANDDWTANITVTDSEGNDVALDIAGNPSAAGSYGIGCLFDAAGNLTTLNGAAPAVLGITALSGDLQFDFDPTTVTQLASSNTLSSSVDNNREPTIVTGSLSIFDSLGNPHTLTITYTKVDDNNWNWSASVPATSGTLTANSGTIAFNADGSVASISPNPPMPTFTPYGGAAPQQVMLNFGDPNTFNGITQTSSDSVVSALSQDGSAAANLTNLSIDQYGFVVGVFSNGQSRQLAQVMLATFPNLNGLTSVGDNMYTVSANSGDPLYAEPGESTGTTIQSGALEQSNVDLSEEFTRMIVAQRGFQANARVITTSDTLLQEITNLVR